MERLAGREKFRDIAGSSRCCIAGDETSRLLCPAAIRAKTQDNARLLSISLRILPVVFTIRAFATGISTCATSFARLTIRLSLIDLQRAFIPKWFKSRWILKDLSQLYYSCPGDLISRADRFRFTCDMHRKRSSAPGTDD